MAGDEDDGRTEAVTLLAWIARVVIAALLAVVVASFVEPRALKVAAALVVLGIVLGLVTGCLERLVRHSRSRALLRDPLGCAGRNHSNERLPGVLRRDLWVRRRQGCSGAIAQRRSLLAK
jgi:hypothetical protein